MHLIINDQAPVALVKQPKVREVATLVFPVRQDLVGRHGHWLDHLGLTRVLAHQFFCKIGLVQNLPPPLLHRRHTSCQHKRVALHQAHRGDSHNRLARPARQNNHT